MVPLSAVATWHQVSGPQAVNHINQFTSVTIFFNLKPGVHDRARPRNFIENAAKEIVPPDMRGDLQGEALTFRNTVSQPDHPDGAGRVRHVRDPGDSLRELSAPDHGALVAAGGAGRRVADAVAISVAEASLYAYIGMFMLMGIVKKNGIMIVDFAKQRVAQGNAATIRRFTKPAWTASARS